MTVIGTRRHPRKALHGPSVLRASTDSGLASVRPSEGHQACIGAAGRLGSCLCARRRQGSADVDEYRIVGTKGHLRVEPAFTYHGELAHHLTIGDGETKTKTFPKSDQFAPELLYFAECIINDEDPEPSGEEGLADVRILEAMVESARSGRPVKLAPFKRTRRPSLELERTKPPVRKPKVVRAQSPTK